MGIEIVKGRPLPKPTATGRPPKYPFHTLKIGDSFDVKPKKGETLYAVAGRVRSSAASWRQRHARGRLSFIVRVVQAESVVRCWAVAQIVHGEGYSIADEEQP